MSCWLDAASEADIDELMTWFSSAHDLDRWAGPKFRFPFDRKSFHKDSRWHDYLSFCLRDQPGKLLAFGQLTYRYGRSHLARLVVHPQQRGQGLGRQLLQELLAVASQKPDISEAALFVYRNNEPAIRCYSAMGFSIAPYPRRARMADECFYMTRPLPAQEAD